MRRGQDSWDTTDLTCWESSYQGGGLTVAASTSAARTGSGAYGMRMNYTGTGRDSAYVQTSFDSGCLFWNAQNEGASQTGFLRFNAASGFATRFYYRTNQPKTSANMAQILMVSEAGDAAGNLMIGVQVVRSGAKRILKLLTYNAGTPVTQTGTFDLTNNFYRYHCWAEVNSSGAGTVWLKVYEENTSTVVEALSGPIDIAVIGADASWIILGYSNIGLASTLNGAQWHDFADWAINDHQVFGSDVHNVLAMRQYGGSCLGLHAPTGDLTSPTTKWTGSDGDTTNNYLLIDDGVTVDDTDKVYTTAGATLHNDRYDHTAYAGSDTIRSV